MKTLTLILVSALLPAFAQPTVAPTTGEPVGNPRGGDFENYNITQSFELGYRFSTTGGGGYLLQPRIIQLQLKLEF